MMKSFYHVLLNTMIAGITTGYLWFALTFWVYLETKSVLATGILGGSYMLLVAIFSILFGSVVDHNKKKDVMVVSSIITCVTFIGAGLMFMAYPAAELLVMSSPLFWVFIGLILAGAVVEIMRGIALSTCVTLLVPKERRPNANGLVGSVLGIGFIVTSVFSGLSIGQLGMGWTLLIAIILTGVSLVHLLTISIPEETIVHDPELENRKIDLRGSIATIIAIPGLFALLIFSTFNNLIGGVYMTLMDPYGLTLFSVEVWGMIFGLAGTGFVIGGLVVAKFGLGKNPLKTLLYVVVLMGILGALFTVREWAWLYIAGIWLYMAIVPVVESAEQTVIQRVVPYKRQGRVFGFAQAFEAAAAPISAFLVAPIAEYIIIPYMNSSQGNAQFGWLIGQGEARGIALVFLASGAIMVVAALLAFMTKSYRQLSDYYEKA